MFVEEDDARTHRNPDPGAKSAHITDHGTDSCMYGLRDVDGGVEGRLRGFLFLDGGIDGRQGRLMARHFPGESGLFVVVAHGEVASLMR